jgi:hypothetical protein
MSFTTIESAPIPRSTFFGTLRQISPASLNASGAAILQTCAPQFLPLSEPEAMARFNAMQDTLDPNVEQFYLNKLPLRRFSGDYFPDFFDEHRLDRGCYHSVCVDQSGRDDGTLADELNAYRSSDVDFYTIFIDCFNESIMARVGLPPSAHIAALVFHPAKLLHRLPPDAPKALKTDLAQAACAGRPYGITLGCVVTQATIEGVLDLRGKDAQDWFFKTYVPEGPFRTPADEFVDILPELVDQNLGGSTPSNMRLQHIGATLRIAGVNALIFPSARNDVEARYKHGTLASWRGWNIVRYTGGPPRKIVHHDIGGWSTEFANGVELRRVSDGHNVTGWRIFGLEARNLHLYDQVMKKHGILRS